MPIDDKTILDMKEMDRRGSINSRIHKLMTNLDMEDLQDTLDFMELRDEVKQARVREIKSEHEGGE